MIIRKPYAFLIKNFKKIHIALLLISLFILYKLIDISGFVNDFIKLGVYDSYRNPITAHITFFLNIAIILEVAGTVALVFLLRYKKKPWKLYLVPFIEYFALLFVLGMIKGFFVGFKYDVKTEDLRLARDLLMIFQFFQLPAIFVYVMRILGLDIKKFNFNSDKEFFELSEKDRDEIEISLDIDKNSFIRAYKRLFRNIGYVYTEHKLICRTIIGIIVFIFTFNTFKFIFVTNRIYSEGQKYSVDGFTYVINKSYFSGKDNLGNEISSKSNFVIVEVSALNNWSTRKIKLENFHLKNGRNDYITTGQTYDSDFKDLGKTYQSVKELRKGDSDKFIIIFKVDKKLKKNRFVLYYQEKNGHLRKIKLKPTDINSNGKTKVINFGEPFVFGFDKVNENITFDDVEYLDNEGYRYSICSIDVCYDRNDSYEAPQDYKIMKLNFSSIDFEAKDMVDFSKLYGKIEYIDSENIKQVIDFDYPFVRMISGKTLYTLVPVDVAESKSVNFVYSIRNDKYIYKIK